MPLPDQIRQRSRSILATFASSAKGRTTRRRRKARSSGLATGGTPRQVTRDKEFARVYISANSGLLGGENPVENGIEVDRRHVAQIVASYLRHHKIDASEIPPLIAQVRLSIARAGHPAPAQAARIPAVPIRRSVQQDYIVCLECGFRSQALRRHLTVRHQLDADAYRTRWKLPLDYPVVAPRYSARRSEAAKRLGLGRKAATASEAGASARKRPAPTAIEAAPAAARRRGRPRRSQPAG
jgi:predicted transcriptional regulator